MTTKFKLAIIAAACITTFNTYAAVEIYNDNDVTFSTDGLINIFYTNSTIDKTDATGVKSDRTQSRVRMGFLPNTIGFNLSKKLDDTKISMRSAFSVSINDTDQFRDPSPADLGTGTLIDVRQFYAKISGSWGEVRVGKDFGIFNITSLLNDENLLGLGQTSDFFGFVDGGNTTYGNASAGYTYPFPKAQITYRSPDMNGFKLAVGVMDPNKMSATSDEELPRFEAELVYDTTFDNGSLKTWISGVTQTSEENNVEQNQTGIGYGANVKFSNISLTASGFQSKGLSYIAALDHYVGPDSIESDGFLTQAAYTLGDNRFILSYGESEVENTGSVLDAVYSNTTFAYYRTILPGLYGVAEYNKTEVDVSNSIQSEENNTLSVGVVVTF